MFGDGAYSNIAPSEADVQNLSSKNPLVKADHAAKPKVNSVGCVSTLPGTREGREAPSRAIMPS